MPDNESNRCAKKKTEEKLEQTAEDQDMGKLIDSTRLPVLSMYGGYGPVPEILGPNHCLFPIMPCGAQGDKTCLGPLTPDCYFN